MKVQRNTLLRAFLAVLVVAAVAAPTAFGSDLRSPDTQDAAKAAQWGRVSDRLLPDTQDAAKASQPASDINMQSPDTQDAAKAGQWGRVSDMLLPDTQDAAKAGQPASAINMQSPDTQDAAEGVRRNGAKARCDLCEHSFVTSQGSLSGRRETPDEKAPPQQGFSEVGGTGLEPVTPSLSSWCSPN